MEAFGLDGEAEQLAAVFFQRAGQAAAVEVFRDQREVGGFQAELHGQVERGRCLAAARDGDQDDVGLLEVAVGDAVVVGQGVVDRFDSLLVFRTFRRAVRAADGVARLAAEFDLQRGEEGFEVGQAEGVGLVDDRRQVLVDQRGEDDRPHAVGFALRVDALQRFLSFVDAVQEGDADLPELDVLELGQQAVAEGFGGEAGAVGDEEYGAFDRIGHDGGGF